MRDSDVIRGTPLNPIEPSTAQPHPPCNVINWVQRMGQMLRHGEKALQIVW